MNGRQGYAWLGPIQSTGPTAHARAMTKNRHGSSVIGLVVKAAIQDSVAEAKPPAAEVRNHAFIICLQQTLVMLAGTGFALLV